MNILTVYGAYVDGGERDLGKLDGYFSDKEVAKARVRGRGWYGSDGHISESKAIDTGKGVYLLADTKPIDLDNKLSLEKERLKAQAFAKLTPEEIKAITS